MMLQNRRLFQSQQAGRVFPWCAEHHAALRLGITAVTHCPHLVEHMHVTSTNRQVYVRRWKLVQTGAKVYVQNCCQKHTNWTFFLHQCVVFS